jgi:hypothetical protein
VLVSHQNRSKVKKTAVRIDLVDVDDAFNDGLHQGNRLSAQTSNREPQGSTTSLHHPLVTGKVVEGGTHHWPKTGGNLLARMNCSLTKFWSNIEENNCQAIQVEN